MFDWMSDLWGVVVTVFQFIVNWVTSLIQAVVVLGNSTSFPLQAVGFMPVIIGSSITIFVAIGVLKFLIGR